MKRVLAMILCLLLAFSTLTATAFAETPSGSPYRYVLLTMDRQNFPGMPSPNWTYGAIYFYGANP